MFHHVRHNATIHCGPWAAVLIVAALAEISQLRGLLPICSYCHNIRNDDDSWQQLEAYISAHSEAEFSHGICPTCCEKHITSHFTGSRN